MINLKSAQPASGTIGFVFFSFFSRLLPINVVQTNAFLAQKASSSFPTHARTHIYSDARTHQLLNWDTSESCQEAASAALAQNEAKQCMLGVFIRQKQFKLPLRLWQTQYRENYNKNRPASLPLPCASAACPQCIAWLRRRSDRLMDSLDPSWAAKCVWVLVKI